MAFLALPTLSIPLLKVPLLLGNVLCTYHGMSPPRAPATAGELKRIGSTPDFLSNSRVPELVKGSAAVAKLLLCGVALTEATVLLAQQFPSPLSDCILTNLLPPGKSPSLRLTALSALACALGIAGGSIRAWCHRSLGQFFTWEVAVRDDHQLITSGPYLIARHPSYTGWVFLMVGNFTLLATEGSYFTEAGLWGTMAGKVVACSVMGYLSWVTINLIKRTASEDEILRKEFGAQWNEWEMKTPYRLIPFVY
ncbi:ICMT-domain-containing protein [Ganoderma leucocontextum]|nr:ICMT-domain-containing protein [Ganoderma leucocontextum]